MKMNESLFLSSLLNYRQRLRYEQFPFINIQQTFDFLRKFFPRITTKSPTLEHLSFSV